MMPATGNCDQKKQQVQGHPNRPRNGPPLLYPMSDITEYDDALAVWADMPGVWKRTLTSSSKDGMLTIPGTVLTVSFIREVGASLTS